VRRERTYSDPRVIAFINEHFVPAAVNINHLQRQADAEGELFRTISWQGRFRLSYEEAKAAAPNTEHRECHQGQYVASIDGELFGSRHTADPDQLLEMMQSGLENWSNRKTQMTKSAVEDVNRDERHVWTYPEDGLVLELGCRDLVATTDVPEEWAFDPHNLNHVWLTADEVREMVPQDVRQGDTFDLPESIHRKLVRFHLLDIVRGETPPWPKDAPDRVPLTVTCTAADGNSVTLVLKGHGILIEQGDWCTQPTRDSVYRRGEMCCSIGERGFEPSILGHATFDRTNQRFTRFDLVAVGTRWGGTTFNFRQRDVAPARMGIAMTIARTALERDRIPPAGSPERYFDA